MSDRLAHFIAGDEGPWKITRCDVVVGGIQLPAATRLAVTSIRPSPSSAAEQWVLRGTTSNLRYTQQAEREILNAKQQGLGRPQATCAAMIPIRKSPAWWDLSQDERRAIFEEQSRHIGIGVEYLPAIARRLYHCHDLGEPFDFITWFEYAPEDATAFEELVSRLRKTLEWQYIDAEMDLRLISFAAPAEQKGQDVRV